MKKIIFLALFAMSFEVTFCLGEGAAYMGLHLGERSEARESEQSQKVIERRNKSLAEHFNEFWDRTKGKFRQWRTPKHQPGSSQEPEALVMDETGDDEPEIIEAKHQGVPKPEQIVQKWNLTMSLHILSAPERAANLSSADFYRLNQKAFEGLQDADILNILEILNKNKTLAQKASDLLVNKLFTTLVSRWKRDSKLESTDYLKGSQSQRENMIKTMLSNPQIFEKIIPKSSQVIAIVVEVAIGNLDPELFTDPKIAQNVFDNPVMFKYLKPQQLQKLNVESLKNLSSEQKKVLIYKILSAANFEDYGRLWQLFEAKIAPIIVTDPNLIAFMNAGLSKKLEVLSPDQISKVPVKILLNLPAEVIKNLTLGQLPRLTAPQIAELLLSQKLQVLSKDQIQALDTQAFSDALGTKLSKPLTKEFAEKLSLEQIQQIFNDHTGWRLKNWFTNLEENFTKEAWNFLKNQYLLLQRIKN